MKKLFLISIIILFSHTIIFAQLHSESPQVQALRQELESQIINQNNETYYQLQDMEIERQTENLKNRQQLKKMQNDIDDLKNSPGNNELFK